VLNGPVGGFSLFLLLIDWRMLPHVADLFLFQLPGLADSCCWLEDSGL
jgi:hypothetical protein